MSLVASAPSIPGIIRSIRTRSGHVGGALTDCLLAVGGNPRDFVAWHAGDHAAQRFDRERNVIDDGDAHHSGGPISSSTAATNVWS